MLKNEVSGISAELAVASEGCKVVGVTIITSRVITITIGLILRIQYRLIFYVGTFKPILEYIYYLKRCQTYLDLIAKQTKKGKKKKEAIWMIIPLFFLLLL